MQGIEKMPNYTTGELEIFVVTLHDEIHNDESWEFTDRDSAIRHAKKVAGARWVAKPRFERNIEGYIFFLPFSEENGRAYIHVKQLQVKVGPDDDADKPVFDSEQSFGFAVKLA
jgi:hypothetical protein